MRKNWAVCFIGGSRYSRPLDETTEKKFCALAELGPVTVVAFSQDAWPRAFREHARFYLLPALPLPFFRYAAMFLAGPLLALWCVLRHGARILVAQSPYEGFAAACVKIVAGWLGKRVVLVVENHGDFEVSLFLERPIMVPRVYRWLMRRVAQFSLSRADLFRAISDSTREQLARWAPRKPVHQFVTWTDISVFEEAGREKAAPDGQEIVFAGVLIPRKGVHYLLNAFARIAADFPQARLVIVGREENRDYVAALKARAKQPDLDGRVELVGELTQAELSARMQDACVFVLPSLSEGLGRVVFEAMATGTPVIASSVGGIVQMVKDGETGFLVPAGDEVALAERLRWVLEHPNEAMEMGQRARAFAEGFFSTETYLRGYRELFQVAESSLRRSEERRAPSPV